MLVIRGVYFVIGIGDFGIKLVGGYSLSRISGGTFQIVSPSRSIAVPPLVVEYAVAGKWVVGRTELDKGESGSVTGYFILDTKSGMVNTGLTRAAWLYRLGKERLAEPELRAPPPTMLDAVLQGKTLR